MVRVVCFLLFLMPALVWAQGKSREQKVREDKQKVEAEGFWRYNDIAGGMAQAKATGKPLLVVLRCIPCEECVKLDDDLVDQDPTIRPLLEQFVCVRQVSTNGLDLSIFQYDTDQSFAVFMLNPDGTIYGRFGTRSHRTEWSGDVSLPGLAEALKGALELHADYPANKQALAGKRGPRPEFSSPEKFPSLKDKYTDALSYSGNVVQSCIHCHQIGEAQREFYRSQNKPIPEAVLFPYPHPLSIGLTLDPKQRATVLAVESGSPADKAGFQPADRIERLAGQPLLSIADVQWVLHTTSPTGGRLTAEIRRQGQPHKLTIELADGWRQAGDLTWRASTWGLRRMATDGLRLEPLSPEDRDRLKLPAEGTALLVKHVGQYGPHAAAKQAGFRQGDVIIEVEGKTDLLREADLLKLGVTQKKAGDRIAVTVLREGRRLPLEIPLQR
jgi:serine protease Do